MNGSSRISKPCLYNDRKANTTAADYKKGATPSENIGDLIMIHNHGLQVQCIAGVSSCSLILLSLSYQSSARRQQLTEARKRAHNSISPCLPVPHGSVCLEDVHLTSN